MKVILMALILTCGEDFDCKERVISCVTKIARGDLGVHISEEIQEDVFKFCFETEVSK